MTTAGSTDADGGEESLFTIRPPARAAAADPGGHPWPGVVLVLVAPVVLAVLVFTGLVLMM